MKKALVLLLALIMLVSAFAACTPAHHVRQRFPVHIFRENLHSPCEIFRFQPFRGFGRDFLIALGNPLDDFPINSGLFQ